MIHGNLAKYAEHLVRDYGASVLLELDRIYQASRDLTNEQLKQIIDKYDTN